MRIAIKLDVIEDSHGTLAKIYAVVEKRTGRVWHTGFSERSATRHLNQLLERGENVELSYFLCHVPANRKVE